MTELARAIDDAIEDERIRAAVPCLHTAPVARIVYDAQFWLCECGQAGCARTWLVTRRPGE